MSLMNKLARKIVKAQRSPGAVSGVTRREPTATGGRPQVTTQPVADQPSGSAQVHVPNAPPIGGLTGRGERHYVGNAPGTRPVKRPKGLRYGGRI